MLEDKYQGNSQFIKNQGKSQKCDTTKKLDQIHHIIHDTYEKKKK